MTLIDHPTVPAPAEACEASTAAATTAPPDWRALLTAEIERTSISDVARRVGCARTAISMVLADKYPAKPDRIIARVLDLLTQVQCPHLGQSIAPADCATHALGAPPTHSTTAADHWRACQRCLHRPADRPAAARGTANPVVA